MGLLWDKKIFMYNLSYVIFYSNADFNIALCWRVARFDAGNDNKAPLKLLPVIALLPFGSHPIKFRRQFVYHIVMRF